MLAFDHPYRLVIHDRDSIFSDAVDQSLRSLGVRALGTPVHGPTANAFCVRVIGTVRRECLDYLLPIIERHLKGILKKFVGITIADVRIRRSGLVFRNHPRLRFRPAPIGIACLPGIASRRPGYSAGHHEYSLDKETA